MLTSSHTITKAGKSRLTKPLILEDGISIEGVQKCPECLAAVGATTGDMPTHNILGYCSTYSEIAPAFGPAHLWLLSSHKRDRILASSPAFGPTETSCTNSSVWGTSALCSSIILKCTIKKINMKLVLLQNYIFRAKVQMFCVFVWKFIRTRYCKWLGNPVQLTSTCIVFTLSQILTKTMLFHSHPLTFPHSIHYRDVYRVDNSKDGLALRAWPLDDSQHYLLPHVADLSLMLCPSRTVVHSGVDFK